MLVLATEDPFAMNNPHQVAMTLDIQAAIEPVWRVGRLGNRERE
jgi:hypothetical protein